MCLSSLLIFYIYIYLLISSSTILRWQRLFRLNLPLCFSVPTYYRNCYASKGLRFFKCVAKFKVLSCKYWKQLVYQIFARGEFAPTFILSYKTQNCFCQHKVVVTVSEVIIYFVILNTRRTVEQLFLIVLLDKK